MVQRIDFLRVCLARAVCCFAAFLAGCAVAPVEKSPPAQSPSTQSGGSEGSSRALVASVPRPAPESELAKVELPESPPPRTVDLTRDVDDLFQRIRRGFAMPDISDELVRYHQQWYLDRPDYLRRMVERGSRYLYHVVDELDKRGLPMELALLPMVESAYNPMAYSRAKASGLWQFIPSTGKHYKLDQDWWKDERRDVVASTAAALEYLQSIYELHGEWHLALASYNWGEGAVGRAIEKNQAQGLPTDYLSLNMPGQTRNYVPKLQALKNIFNDQALVSALDLPKVPNQPYFVTYTTGARIDVDVAARLAEMPVDEFVALNPAHKRPVIQPDTSLVIPAEKLETFVGNLAAHGDENKPLSSWRSYTLRPGEQLDKVAQRFGMTLARLRAVNGIRGKTRPAPGMVLLVQGNDRGRNTASAARPGSPDRIRNAAEKAGKPAALPAKASPKNTLYTVRRGDTIYSIARRFKVAEEDLIRRNRVRPKTLKVGTTLTIPAENS
jgi:membrane-bound lytic murein transglycosylase D